MKLIIDIPDSYKDLLPNIQNGSIACKIILDAVKNGVSYSDDYINRPKGKWEFVQYDGNPNIGNWHCSLCRHIIFQKFKSTANYCPYCGADMRGEEE